MLFGALMMALPAAAQFGAIFGGPPRPPADVPSAGPPNNDDRYYSSRSNPSPWTRNPQVVAPPPQGYPQQSYPPPPQGYPQQSYPPQQGYPPQQPGYPPQQAGRPPGGVQQQDLPPPPGATAAAPPARGGPQPANPVLPGLPPGQRQPTGTPGETPATPAPPNDEVVIAPPAQRIPNNQAVFSGLDKITGRIISFDVAINETVQFGALQVTPRVCYTRPPTETANTDAFIEVDEITLQGEIKRLFTGWMFAATPGLHAIEHPIYDVWLADCKGPQTAGCRRRIRRDAAGLAAPGATKAAAAAETSSARAAERGSTAAAGAAAASAAAVDHPLVFLKLSQSPHAGPSRRREGILRGIVLQRSAQHAVIARLRQLDRAEGLQMIGEELRIEQPVSAGSKPRHEMNQRDLRGIARDMKHALAEERAPKAHAIEPTNELFAVIDLDGVAMPDVEQRAVEQTDARIDPGARALRPGRRASVDHGAKIAIAGDGEASCAHGARKARGNVERVKRDDPALLRLDPVERWIIRILGHRKDAARIGLEQHFGRELKERGLAAGHGKL